jgi:uncharacterized protein YprB with RNaseH-like and TPR domain
MLQQTFAHVTGIGERTERRLWGAGIGSWLEFLRVDRARLLGPARSDRVAREIEESVRRYDRAEWRYFNERLPGSCKWRAFGDLGDRALCVDIETDGGTGPENITMIGAFDGTTVRTFIAGRDLDRAVEYLEQFPLVISFNGARFDLPLILRRFPYHLFNFIHLDLVHPLHRLGVGGGLKSVEKKLDIRRCPETEGLDGWDAVRLWNRYRSGDAAALDRLVQYNAEDTRNLLPLAQWAYARLSEAARRSAAAGSQAA